MKKPKMKYQICVSGAARGKSVEEGKHLAYIMGKLIVEEGHSLLTGATIGLPYMAALGAKEAGGQSIGISPAASRVEHIKKYRLPTDAFDFILYSGLNYVGRDTLLVNCAEAVISIGGRMGTLHEFTVAVETGKPVGVLEGAGGTSAEFDELIEAANFSRSNFVADPDPKTLLKKITALLNKKYARLAMDEPNIITGKPQPGAKTSDLDLDIKK